jgi:hypothetical protein
LHAALNFVARRPPAVTAPCQKFTVAPSIHCDESILCDVALLYYLVPAATTANKMTMQRLANDITSKADLPGKKVRGLQETSQRLAGNSAAACRNSTAGLKIHHQQGRPARQKGMMYRQCCSQYRKWTFRGGCAVMLNPTAVASNVLLCN